MSDKKDRTNVENRVERRSHQSASGTVQIPVFKLAVIGTPLRTLKKTPIELAFGLLIKRRLFRCIRMNILKL